MATSTSANPGRGGNAKGSGISRRSILRGLIPAVAAAAGVAARLGSGEATATATATATGANAPGRGIADRRTRRDRRDRRDRGDERNQDRDRRDENAGGQPADRRRRPRPGRTPSPAPVAPSLISRYSYDASGILTVEGSNFLPGIPVTITYQGVWSDGLGPYTTEFSLPATPDAYGTFSISVDRLCPNLIVITATQSGVSPITHLPDYGIYTCLLP